MIGKIRTNLEWDEEAALQQMDEYLKGYGFNRKLLQLSRYEKQFFSDGDEERIDVGEEPLARARMFAVRHFIMGLPNGDEKMMLYYHYVRGESVARCAEMLGISRASGFRLRKRALLMAARHYNAEKGGDDN